MNHFPVPSGSANIRTFVLSFAFACYGSLRGGDNRQTDSNGVCVTAKLKIEFRKFDLHGRVCDILHMVAFLLAFLSHLLIQDLVISRILFQSWFCFMGGD